MNTNRLTHAASSAPWAALSAAAAFVCGVAGSPDSAAGPTALPGAPTVLGIEDTRFTLNGQPTFLLGISYYGALGASEAFVRSDLDDLQRHGFNWLRVWATWGAFDHDVSAVDAQGGPREPFLGRLQWLVAECDRRGLVVDVTLTRSQSEARRAGAVGLPDFQAHQRAVGTLIEALRPHRNWYLDLANERDVRDARYVSPAELKSLRELARRLDPPLLVTASFGGHDLTESDVRDALLTAGCDFLAPHRPRAAGSPAQTEAATRACLALAEAVGRVVPVHFQEPFRRGYTSWEPTAADFLTDLRGARAGGAAGWCFHNGSQRQTPDNQPRRSFDLRSQRLFEQLDDEERRVVAEAGRQPSLSVSRSGRYLTEGDRPFLWLGDTAWLLAQVPSREELELYLRTRAEQGFTVIQLTAVMGEERVWGTARRTSRGDEPFLDNDVLKPAVTPGSDPADPGQYDYWDHLDHVLERIHAHGLRAALVTYFVGWRGDGYKFLKLENARQYGHFLGARYRGKPEILWVLGGDNTPQTDAQQAVWPLVAQGLAEGLTGQADDSRTLMTYHINGGASSAQLWHDSPWLDFNMAQTWDAYEQIYPALRRDFERMPAKPCGLGEGAYEDGPQYPTKPINALVIRQQACWSWFAGGYHTYGNGNVWHFDTCQPELTQPWKEALRSPGAASLRHSKNFLAKIGWWNFVPDATLFAAGEHSGRTRNVAMRSLQGDALAVYFASPATVELRLEKIAAGDGLSAQWTNPATGEERPAATVDPQARSFTPPPGWEDALLHVAAQKPASR